MSKGKCFMIAATVWTGVHFGLYIMAAYLEFRAPAGLFAVTSAAFAIVAYYAAKNHCPHVGSSRGRHLNTGE